MPDNGSGSGSWQDYNQQRGAGGGNSYRDWGMGLLGGPIGWIADATGNQNSINQTTDFAHLWKNTTLNPSMTEDVYNSMNAQEWDAFRAMDQGHQDQFIKQRASDVAAKGVSDAANKDQQDKQASYDTWRTQVLQQLQSFANKMNMSVADLVATKDTGVISAMGQGVRAAGNQNLAAGMSGMGGLSDLNTQKAAMDSMQGYQMQRAGLGLQATQALQGGLQQQYMNYTQQQQYNQQMQLQLQQAQAAQQMFQYQQGKAQAGQTTGMIGGIAGAYFGGPAGAQAGYNIGSSVGQNSYPSYGGYNYQYPSGQSPFGSGQNSGGTGGLGGGYKPNGQ